MHADGAPQVELYASLASAYCYFAIERASPFVAAGEIAIDLVPVLPMALRRPGFYDDAPAQEAPYLLRDMRRTAAFLGLTYVDANPPVIAFASETDWRPTPDQRRLERLYGLMLAASDQVAGFAFAREVMREIWGGRGAGWDRDERLDAAARRAGLKLAQLAQAAATTEAERADRLSDNDARLSAAGHWGTPCFVHDGEPFFGQDRFDQLLWRLGLGAQAARPALLTRSER